MKHIISFSGGMGSFAEAKACVDKYGKENVILLFCDTLMEDEDLYRFLEETVKFLDCELVTLCHGQTPWELFKEQKFIANHRIDLCSRTLKRDLMSHLKTGWLFKNYGKEVKIPVTRSDGKIAYYDSGEPVTETFTKLEGIEVHVGIDFSEHHRLTRLQAHMKPSIYRSTLVEDGRIIAKDFSEQFGIRKPRLYELGFGHNNCGGFCVKAGLGHFKTLHEKLPERYKFHEEKEQEVIAIGGLPFLKKTINGKLRYLTMKEYREEFLELNKAEEDKYDIGGCACALPLGDD